MRLTLLVLIAVALAGFGTYFYTALMPMTAKKNPVISTSQKSQNMSSTPAAAPVTISRPESSSSLSGIGALGYIEPRSRILRISHDAGPDGARIEKLNVETGDVLHKNDTIAVFSDYGRKLAKRDSIAKDIPRLQAQLGSENANLNYAKNDYQRIKDASLGAITINMKEKAQLDIKRAQANIQSIESEIEAARANLVLAEEEMVQSRVVAPINGTVLTVHARAGERVGEKGIIEMADLDHLDIIAEVYEQDIARVTIGQAAEITVPGLDTPLAGKVYEVGHMVQKNNLIDTDPLASRDLRVIPVRIELGPDTPEPLKNMLKLQVSVRLM